MSKLSILLGIAGNHLTDEEYAGFMLSISFKQEHKKELENCLKYLTFDDIFISKEAFKVYFTSCIRENDNSEKDALRIIPVMMNTYHNLCNGINVFQDDNGRNLGEKSQDEMRQKYKEVVNKFGPETDNDECMRPQPYLKQITEA
ncbi:MAG: hypothetical protein IJJ74_04565 [Eubacterium sp.]|nr:hypothetical protein [Eubacterium sp.]